MYNSLNDLMRSQHGIAASQSEFLRYLRDHPGTRVADLAEFSAVGVGATGRTLVHDADTTFATITGLIHAALEPAHLDAATRALRALRATLERDKIGNPVG